MLIADDQKFPRLLTPSLVMLLFPRLHVSLSLSLSLSLSFSLFLSLYVSLFFYDYHTQSCSKTSFSLSGQPSSSCTIVSVLVKPAGCDRVNVWTHMWRRPCNGPRRAAKPALPHYNHS